VLLDSHLPTLQQTDLKMYVAPTSINELPTDLSHTQSLSHVPHFSLHFPQHVLVLEKSSQAGNKILISGGSRCNILPALPSLDPNKDFFTDSSLPSLKAVLKSWTLDQCRDWLSDDIGIPLSLEEDSQKLFPTSNSAVEVRDKLLDACIRRGVEFRYNARLKRLTPTHSVGTTHSTTDTDSTSSSSSWLCELDDGQCIEVSSVILATGGSSFPKLGTTGDGYPILKRLGHRIEGPPYPALTPLLAGHPGNDNLAGLSLQSSQLTVTGSIMSNDIAIDELNSSTMTTTTMKKAKKKKKKKKQQQHHVAYRTAMLFTHKGVSGPAILDQSHFFTAFNNSATLKIPQLTAKWVDTMGEQQWEEELNLAVNKTNAAKTVGGVLRRKGIPQRLVEALCAETSVPTSRKLTDLKKIERMSLVKVLSGYVFKVVGDEGFGKAEVTGGGVALNELDSRTMESKIYPGLYVVGELCDVFGRIGGFNFAWAWYSGRLAGLATVKEDGRRLRGEVLRT
jgi:predicted flavoprotein YhiN